MSQDETKKDEPTQSGQSGEVFALRPIGKPIQVTYAPLIVTIKFTFPGPVTKEQLFEAIRKSVRTKQFGLNGHYEILEIKTDES